MGGKANVGVTRGGGAVERRKVVAGCGDVGREKVVWLCAVGYKCSPLHGRF